MRHGNWRMNWRSEARIMTPWRLTSGTTSVCLRKATASAGTITITRPRITAVQDGDFRNESMVSQLVIELGWERVRQLDLEAARWLADWREKQSDARRGKVGIDTQPSPIRECRREAGRHHKGPTRFFPPLSRTLSPPIFRSPLRSPGSSSLDHQSRGTAALRHQKEYRRSAYASRSLGGGGEQYNRRGARGGRVVAFILRCDSADPVYPLGKIARHLCRAFFPSAGDGLLWEKLRGICAEGEILHAPERLSHAWRDFSMHGTSFPCAKEFFPWDNSSGMAFIRR